MAFAMPPSNLMLTVSESYVLAGNLSEAHNAAYEVIHAVNKERDEDAPTQAQDARAQAILRAVSIEEAGRAIWPGVQGVRPRLR